MFHEMMFFLTTRYIYTMIRDRFFHRNLVVLLVSAGGITFDTFFAYGFKTSFCTFLFFYYFF